MFIIGGLGLCCGVVCGGAAAALSPEQLEQMASTMAMRSPPELHMSVAQVMQLMLAISAVLVGLVSIVTLILAVFVRGGSRGAMIGGIVVMVLILGWQLISLVLELLAGAMPSALVSLLMCGAVGVSLMWLAQAMRAARQGFGAPWPSGPSAPEIQGGLQWPKEYGYGVPPNYPQADKGPQQMLGPIPPPPDQPPM
jgi:hypothetical protein